MKADNKGVLVYSLDPSVKGVEPRARFERTKRFDSRFTLAKQYDGGAPAFEKGWLYSFVGGEEASGFIALGFDGSNSFLFNELRANGKTFRLGEGLHAARFDSRRGSARIREPGVELDWSGANACYRVRFKCRKDANELELVYSFKRIKQSIGGYRAVFEEYGGVLGYFIFSPCHGKLEIKVKGDAEVFSKGLSCLANKTVESDFAYCENVRSLVPFASMGWHWTLLCCRDPAGRPEKIVGFMDMFFGKAPGIPLNLQLYSVDLATGRLDVYGNPRVRYSHGAIPSLAVESRDKALSLAVRKVNAGAEQEIRGKKLAGVLETADIDYRAYPSKGVVKFNGKRRAATGTSEYAGFRKGYWL
ncbi:MAG: hypothetical protein WC607_02355 [Candidatus Micrarchaeia archaeon]